MRVKRFGVWGRGLGTKGSGSGMWAQSLWSGDSGLGEGDFGFGVKRLESL